MTAAGKPARSGRPVRPSDPITLRLVEAYLDALGPRERRALLAALDAPDPPRALADRVPGLQRLCPEGVPALPPGLRRTLQGALAARIAAERPAEVIAGHCRTGRVDCALGALRAAGGPFFSMTNGLEASLSVAAQFPEALREAEPDLALLDAVNALKSGNTPLAGVILQRIGRRHPLPDLERCGQAADVALVCVLFVKAIYEDQPLSDAALAALSEVLARLPDEATLERGLLYNVGLDVCMRSERFAMAEEAALRALRQFEAVDAPGLAFYILLYLAVIALGRADLARAQARLDEARAALADFAAGSGNDALLLRSLELIVAYEGGAPEPLLRHLTGAGDTVPFGELWPAMAEPIMAHGRRALATELGPRAALSWVRRWRLRHWRSQQFDRLISVQEALACQDMQRWQSAEELLDRAGADGRHGFDYWLARHASALDRAPRSEELGRVLQAAAESDRLTPRQLAMARLLLAQSAAARGMDGLAVRMLGQIVEVAGPARLPRFLPEQAGPIRAILRHRGVAGLVRRRPQLNRVLGGLRAPRAAPDLPEGLTRQEHRVLLLIAEDLPNKAIAQRLGLSMATVKFHVGNLLRKAGMRNRRALAEHAAASGWLA